MEAKVLKRKLEIVTVIIQVNTINLLDFLILHGLQTMADNMSFESRYPRVWHHKGGVKHASWTYLCSPTNTVTSEIPFSWKGCIQWSVRSLELMPTSLLLMSLIRSLWKRLISKIMCPPLLNIQDQPSIIHFVAGKHRHMQTSLIIAFSS